MSSYSNSRTPNVYVANSQYTQASGRITAPVASESVEDDNCDDSICSSSQMPLGAEANQFTQRSQRTTREELSSNEMKDELDRVFDEIKQRNAALRQQGLPVLAGGRVKRRRQGCVTGMDRVLADSSNSLRNMMQPFMTAAQMARFRGIAPEIPPPIIAASPDYAAFISRFRYDSGIRSVLVSRQDIPAHLIGASSEDTLAFINEVISDPFSPYVAQFRNQSRFGGLVRVAPRPNVQYREEFVRPQAKSPFFHQHQLSQPTDSQSQSRKPAGEIQNFLGSVAGMRDPFHQHSGQMDLSQVDPKPSQSDSFGDPMVDDDAATMEKFDRAAILKRKMFED